MITYMHTRKTPPLPVPSPDEKGGGDTRTATRHYILTATLNATHPKPERTFHGRVASCPEVVAERTLPAAWLRPSGWQSMEPYRQAFPSGGPAGRTRWNGFSEPSSA